MRPRNKLFISLLFFTHFGFSQGVSGVYHIDELIARLNKSDTTYVVNFWATWCKPCVEELKGFDSLNTIWQTGNRKIILVSLDFKEDLEKKVIPFLKAKKIQSTCVLLDEVNGNDFINKIDANWSGAIPATLFKSSKRKIFVEKKLQLRGLLDYTNRLN